MKPSRTLSGLPRDRSLPHPNVLHFLSIEKLRPPGLFPEFQRANLIREVKKKCRNKGKQSSKWKQYQFSHKKSQGPFISSLKVLIIFWAISLSCFADTKTLTRKKLAAWWPQVQWLQTVWNQKVDDANFWNTTLLPHHLSTRRMSTSWWGTLQAPPQCFFWMPKGFL